MAKGQGRERTKGKKVTVSLGAARKEFNRARNHPELIGALRSDLLCPAASPSGVATEGEVLHVPGEAASPVKPAALWLAVPRWLFKASTPFAKFSSVLLHIRMGKKLLPPPHLASRCLFLILRSTLRASVQYRRRAEMTATNLVIAVLNWLSLGQPPGCPPSIRLGSALSGQQRRIGGGFRASLWYS